MQVLFGNFRPKKSVTQRGHRIVSNRFLDDLTLTKSLIFFEILWENPTYPLWRMVKLGNLASFYLILVIVIGNRVY